MHNIPVSWNTEFTSSLGRSLSCPSDIFTVFLARSSHAPHWLLEYSAAIWSYIYCKRMYPAGVLLKAPESKPPVVSVVTDGVRHPPQHAKPVVAKISEKSYTALTAQFRCPHRDIQRQPHVHCMVTIPLYCFWAKLRVLFWRWRRYLFLQTPLPCDYR